MKRARPTRSTLAAKVLTRALTGAVLAGGVAGCTVEPLPDASRPAIVNSCGADSECGPNGVCTDGTCYSRLGIIDEVLLEIVPEASSPLAGVSLLSMQDNLRRGASSRAITLLGPVPFSTQVVVNGEDLPADCPYLHAGKQSVAARVQFVRVGSVGGVSVAGLSNRFSLTVTTEQNSSRATGGFSKSVSLVPGFYDIYAQPVASNNCQIPSKLWRGVEVGRDGEILAWAPPATLELAKPLRLNGRVTRTKGESLADWQVDIIDPNDERVISTSARLGATTDASPTTNFEIDFQPVAQTVTPHGSLPAILPGGTEPLIRLRPPKNENTVPAVYFDLEGAAGTGQVNLDVSRLPAKTQLVTVSGQVRGDTTQGVKSTVKFLSTLAQDMGLLATYGPVVSTDATGRYSTELFPGKYRIVVIPEGAADDRNVVPGANVQRAWALTEQAHTVVADRAQTVDITVLPTRRIEGVATAGADDVPAQGATLEAAPLIADFSVLTTVISPRISPAPASVAVDDKTGSFTLVLDPGDYDFALKPAAASKFAWWILPSIHVLSVEPPGQRPWKPQLLYPVPFAGTITVVMHDKSVQTLRNATVQAYARTPDKPSVTQVGSARTDDMGRYQLALPPIFGSLP
jgi:hypothetical protein